MFAITNSKLIRVNQTPSGAKLHRHFDYIGSGAGRCGRCIEDFDPPWCVNPLDSESSNSKREAEQQSIFCPYPLFIIIPRNTLTSRSRKSFRESSSVSPLQQHDTQDGVAIIIRNPFCNSRDSISLFLSPSLFPKSYLNKLRLHSPTFATLGWYSPRRAWGRRTQLYIEFCNVKDDSSIGKDVYVV